MKNIINDQKYAAPGTVANSGPFPINRNSKVSFPLTPCFSKVHPLPPGASTVSTVSSLFRNLCLCHGPEAVAVRTISSLNRKSKWQDQPWSQNSKIP
jgi:hypothetical protein